MTSSTVVRPSDPTLQQALRLAAVFALLKLAFTFALTLWTTHIGYGYFRDEFYYLACGHHLAWGYVDHGPIVALQARLGEILFGKSVFAIRILSAVAGAVMIFLTGLITWALGGRRPAQSLAMLGLILTPQFIGTDGFLSMNSCEAMFWMTCVLALLLILRGRSEPFWWTLFGISAGIGLLNKPSMLFFLVALGIGLLCTPQRKLLFTRWAALGIVLLTLIALPNVLWQIHNHWPTLEFLNNGKRLGKNTILGPIAFFLAQFATIGPLNALLWITGIIATLRAKSIARARWLGITYLVFYAMMYALHAKDYYLAGIYPALFAAGAIAWEHRFSTSASVRDNRIYAFPIYETILIVATALILPMASPILPPTQWVAYTHKLHLVHKETENDDAGPLPQFYADRFIWNEQLTAVLTAFRSLTPAEQSRVCIFGKDYGEAGAIDFLGPMQQPNLPPAIGAQNSYWTWGTHNCDPNLIIAIISDKPDAVAKKYDSVQQIPFTDNPWAMPFERHRKIYILRGNKPSAPFNWEDERFYY
ncbi:MAG: glycosyltransferase family 39 protein [Acidobacteriota bacterium]